MTARMGALFGTGLLALACSSSNGTDTPAASTSARSTSTASGAGTTGQTTKSETGQVAAPAKRFERAAAPPSKSPEEGAAPDWPVLSHADAKAIVSGHFYNVGWQRNRMGLRDEWRPRVAVGGSAGPVLFAEKAIRGDRPDHATPSLHRYTGTTWEPVPVEGWVRALRRLANGSTLISADRVYELDTEGRLTVREDVSPRSRPVQIGDTVWLVDGSAEPALYHKPIDEAAYRPAAPRTRATREPAAVPEPARYSDACKTPFLHLVSPPSTGWEYNTTRAQLNTLEDLQSEITFVEYESGGVVHFGAQCSSKEVADKLAAHVAARIPSIKPILQCLDAVSIVGDAERPPKNARIVDIDLFAGEMP